MVSPLSVKAGKRLGFFDADVIAFEDQIDIGGATGVEVDFAVGQILGYASRLQILVKFACWMGWHIKAGDSPEVC